METKEEKITSLSIIAQEYDSDVDTEDNKCLDTKESLDLNKSEEVLDYANTNAYRVTGEQSSSKDSDSDSSDSDSDSSDSERSVTSESDSSSSSESDEDNNISENKNKIKHNKTCYEKKKDSELNLPLIQDLQISVPENSCVSIGRISWIVESTVIIHPTSDNRRTLNLDTVLFVDKGRKALGRIEDVFGPVTDPHYAVRFNSLEHIQENGISVGMEVYYCPDSSYTKYVFLSELFTQRGNDAEDIEEDEVPDFSDDEEEMRYYEMKKKTTETINSENSTVPNKQARNSTFGFKTNHPWNRNTKKNFQRRKSQVRYNDSQSPSNSYNPSQRPPCANFNYFNDQFYGYMPYSNNLQTNDTNNTSIPPNPRLPFGMFPRFQFNSSSTPYNGHNPFSPSRMRFPRANLHFQSQQAPYATSMRLPFATPSPYLFPPSYPPPPPPPPSAPFSSSIEQNHDTSQ